MTSSLLRTAALVMLAAACGGASSKAIDPAAQPAKESPSRAVIGKAAPSFSRPLLSRGGKGNVGVPTHRAATVVIFFATWSEPDLKAVTKLAEVARHHPEAEFIAVGLDDEEKHVLPALNERGGSNLALVWDANHDIAQKYVIDVTPKIYILDQDAIVRFIHGGYHDGEGFAIDIELSETLHKDICSRETGPNDDGEVCFQHCDRLAKAKCPAKTLSRCRSECKSSNVYRNRALEACRSTSVSRTPPPVPKSDADRDGCKEVCHHHDYALGTCEHQSGKQPALLAECKQACGDRCWPICER